MNTEKLEKLKKSLDNKFIPDNMKDKIRAEIKKLEADIKTDETITATEVKEEVKEIEKKVEKALEVAEEKEEKAEAKKEEAEERAEAKAEEKKAKKSRTKTQKVEGKPKSAKKSVFSIAKEIRKDGETWEEAKDRARKMMKSETTETKKKTKTETQKLLAMVRRNKEYKKLTGSSDLLKDAQRRALPRGKRVSENGNVYYENRANRVDVGGFKNAYLENGGGVDGIIELKPLALIPLSTQLNRLSGYGWTYGDWESEDGGKPSTMPNSVIVNVHTKQKFRLSPFYIYEGYDHYNSKPLYRVEDASEEGEYVGEWYKKREDAEQELKEMFGSYADKGVYVETLDEEIDLTDDGKPRVIKTQQGGNKSFGERREMHGASPEALAFDNGGKVGRYSILGEVDGGQPVLYATTDDKERIKPLVNMAEIDLYELTGKKHRIFVTDEVTDDEVYHYGNGGRTRERRYVNHSQDYEVRYSKDKPHRRGYGYAGGGVVLDNVKIEVYKSFHGLKAENYFDDVNGYDWNVVTMKRHTGELVSSARGGKANKSEGNVEFFTFDYNSPNIKLISSRPSRVTEKVIEIQHSQALQLFKEKMEEGNFADGGTIIGTPETPLARGLDIDYTGLVGETGGMSAGEMFAEGGSIGQMVNFEDWQLYDRDTDLERMKKSCNAIRKNGFKAIVVEDKGMYYVLYKSMSDSEGKRVYAEGGSLGNHGLKQGDQIIKTMSGGVQKVKTKSGDIVYVNLANGYRGAEPPLPFAKGGYTNERRHVNKSQDYEVRYAKNKPNRTGYLGKRSFDDGGLIEEFNPKSFSLAEIDEKLRDNDIYIQWLQMGDLNTSADKRDFLWTNTSSSTKWNKVKDLRLTISDYGLLELSKGSENLYLNFVVYEKDGYDPMNIQIYTKDNHAGLKQFARQIVDKFEEGGYMTDPNFGDFQNGVYKYGGEVEYAIKGYKEYTEKLWKGDDYFSEKYAVNELAELELDLRKLNDGYLSPSKVVGKGYKNAKKVAQDWLNEQIKKQKSIIETRGLSNRTNQSNFRSELRFALNENMISEEKFNTLIDESNEIIDSLGETYATGGVTKNYIGRNQLNTITIKKGNQKLTYKVSDVYNGAYKLEEGGNLEKTAFYVSKRNVVKVQLKNGKDVKVANGYWIKKGAKPIHTSKYEDGGQLEMKFLKGGKLESKIQKKVDEVNSLIEKAIDKDGDPIMVVDKSGTWEEPMQYKPIVYKNGRLYFEYYEPYSGKTQKEVVNKSNIEFDGYPMLLDIAKMYRSALKQKGISFAVGGKTTFKEKATAIAKKFEGKKVEPKYQKEYGKTYDKAEAKEVGNKIAGSQKAKYDSKMSGGGSTKRGGAMQLAKQIRKDGESWQSALKRANEQMRKK